jgi:hypothetical protein
MKQLESYAPTPEQLEANEAAHSRRMMTPLAIVGRAKEEMCGAPPATLSGLSGRHQNSPNPQRNLGHMWRMNLCLCNERVWALRNGVPLLSRPPISGGSEDDEQEIDANKCPSPRALKLTVTKLIGPVGWCGQPCVTVPDGSRDRNTNQRAPAEEIILGIWMEQGACL